jgi:hypothetical protein
LFNEVNRQQIEERKEQMIKKREPAIISAIMEKMRKEKEGEPIIETDNVKEFIEKEDKNTDSFIEEQENLLRGNNIAAAAAGGGEKNETENLNESELLQQDTKVEPDDDYDIFSKRTRTNFCENITKNGIINKGDLHPLLNRCNNF